MADRLKVSADNMKSDYEQMKEKIDKLDSNANEIIDLLEELNNYYEGPAYDTFRNVVKAGLDQLEQLSKFWKNYINSFQEADKCYKDTERKVYDTVHDIQVWF